MSAARKRTVCTVLGCTLIFCALILLVWQQGAAFLSARRSGQAVEAIRACIPEPQNAAWEERTDNQMPVLSVDGRDYLGLLELPAHGATLPVLAEQERRLAAPARCEGSIYDGSLVLAASTARGQLDFYQALSVGETVYLTDVTGSRFACQITEILYRDRAAQNLLDTPGGALTLLLEAASGQTVVVCADPVG